MAKLFVSGKHIYHCISNKLLHTLPLEWEVKENKKWGKYNLFIRKYKPSTFPEVIVSIRLNHSEQLHQNLY